MEFPLAQRELTQAGRDWRTYVLRTVLAGGAVVFLLLTWMFRTLVILSSPGASNLTGGIEIMGQSLAGATQAVQLLAAFLVAPVVSASLICTERQEGTLGLLLMADLSGRDVFLAKFLRAFLFTELLLISMLPFASFAALLGGVSIPDVAARLVVLTCYAAAVCAVGLLFSALSRRPAMAFFLTVLFTLVWLACAYAIDAYLFPSFGITEFRLSALALYEDFLQFDDILHIIVPQSVSALAVAFLAAVLTIRILPTLVSPSSARDRKPVSARRRAWRRSAFFDPAAQIIASGSGGFISGLRPGPVRALVFVIIAVLSGIPICVGSVIVQALMFYDIISSLHAARRDGSLDELVLTPLPDHDLARAVFRASLRPALFFGSAAAVFALGVQLFTLFQSTTYWSIVAPSSLVQWGDFSLENVFGIALRLITAVLTILMPIASAVMGAAIASYIGVQRGGAARHTVTCLVISFFLSSVLTTGYYFILFALMGASQALTLPGLWEPLIEVIAQCGVVVLHLAAYAAVTLAFISMLAGSVRRHLASQPEIYIAVARPARPGEHTATSR